MNEHGCFPEIYDEGIKYICDDYDSQGLGEMFMKVPYSALKFLTS